MAKKQSFNLESQFYKFIVKETDRKEQQIQKEEQIMKLRREQSEAYKLNLGKKYHKKSQDSIQENDSTQQLNQQQSENYQSKNKNNNNVKASLQSANNETQHDLDEFERKQLEILNGEEELTELQQEEKYQKAQIQLIRNNHSLTEQQKEVKIKMLQNKNQQNNRVQNIFQKHQSKMQRKYQHKGRSDKFESNMKIFKDLDTYLETKGLIQNMNDLNSDQQHQIKNDYAKLKIQQTFQKYGSEMQMFMNKGSNQENSTFSLQSNVLNSLDVLEKAQYALKSQKKIPLSLDEQKTLKIMKLLENDKKLFEKNPLDVQTTDNDIFFDKLTKDLKEDKFYQEQDKEHELDEQQIQMLQRQMQLYQLENKQLLPIEDDEQKQQEFKNKAKKVMNLLVKTTKNILKKKVSTLGEEAMTVEYQRQRRRERKQEALRETVESQKAKIELENNLKLIEEQKNKKKAELLQKKIKERKLALGLLSDEELEEEVSDVASEDIKTVTNTYQEMKKDMRRKSLRASLLNTDQRLSLGQNLLNVQQKNPNHKFERILEEEEQEHLNENNNQNRQSSSSSSSSSNSRITYSSKESDDFEDEKAKQLYIQQKIKFKLQEKQKKEEKKQREIERQIKLKKKQEYQNIHKEFRQMKQKSLTQLQHKISFGSESNLNFRPTQKKTSLYATSIQNLDDTNRRTQINQYKNKNLKQINQLNQSAVCTTRQSINSKRNIQDSSRLDSQISRHSMSEFQNNNEKLSQSMVSSKYQTASQKDLLNALGIKNGMSKYEIQKKLLNLNENQPSLFDLTAIQQQKQQQFQEKRISHSQQKIQKQYQTMLQSSSHSVSIQIHEQPALKLPLIQNKSSSYSSQHLGADLNQTPSSAKKSYKSPKRMSSLISPNNSQKYGQRSPSFSSQPQKNPIMVKERTEQKKQLQQLLEIAKDEKLDIKEYQQVLIPETEQSVSQYQKDLEKIQPAKPEKLESIRYIEKNKNHNDMFKANRNISKKSMKLVM